TQTWAVIDEAGGWAPPPPTRDVSAHTDGEGFPGLRRAGGRGAATPRTAFEAGAPAHAARSRPPAPWESGGLPAARPARAGPPPRRPRPPRPAGGPPRRPAPAPGPGGAPGAPGPGRAPRRRAPGAGRPPRHRRAPPRGRQRRPALTPRPDRIADGTGSG